MECRDESQRLDQCSRLYDSSVSNDGFELDASRIVQVAFHVISFVFISFRTSHQITVGQLSILTIYLCTKICM